MRLANIWYLVRSLVDFGPCVSDFTDSSILAWMVENLHWFVYLICTSIGLGTICKYYVSLVWTRIGNCIEIRLRIGIGSHRFALFLDSSIWYALVMLHVLGRVFQSWLALLALDLILQRVLFLDSTFVINNQSWMGENRSGFIIINRLNSQPLGRVYT